MQYAALIRHFKSEYFKGKEARESIFRKRMLFHGAFVVALPAKAVYMPFPFDFIL